MASADTPHLDWERLATNLRVERGLLSVLDILAGLPVVVFKGATLTRLIYGDLRRRSSADNDIWVRGGLAEQALSRLEALDYRPLAGLDSRAALRRFGQVALWKGGDLDEVSIDLHAEPFSARYFDVRESDLVPHLIEVDLHGRPIVTFDRSLAFTHMVAHWVQHHLEASHLTTIAAAYDAWSGTLADQELLNLAGKTCTCEALEAALRLCQPESPLPGAFIERPSLRVRFVITGMGISKVPSSPTAKFLALFLVAPHRLPEGIFQATFLEHDDLMSRYGKGSRMRLLVRHLWRSLGGSKAPTTT